MADIHGWDEDETSKRTTIADPTGPFGEGVAGSLYGYNLINATYYEGFLGADTLPLSGKFDLHDSEFKQVGGTNLYNLYNARASITGNTYKDSFEGMDIGNISHTKYEFAGNDVFNIAFGATLGGVYVYGPWDTSTLSIRNNDFTGVYGPFFDNSTTFAGTMKCQLLNNQTAKTTDVGIYLGTGVSDCFVECPRGGTVENLGTDNTLIGCRKP